MQAIQGNMYSRKKLLNLYPLPKRQSLGQNGWSFHSEIAINNETIMHVSYSKSIFTFLISTLLLRAASWEGFRISGL